MYSEETGKNQDSARTPVYDVARNAFTVEHIAKLIRELPDFEDLRNPLTPVSIP
jgi:hypothetical protein